MKVLSVNLGKRRFVEWRGKTYETDIFKSSVVEPLFLGVDNVQKDIIADWKSCYGRRIEMPGKSFRFTHHSGRFLV